MKATIYNIIAEEDKVVTRFTVNSTNEKPYVEIPAKAKLSSVINSNFGPCFRHRREFEYNYTSIMTL